MRLRVAEVGTVLAAACCGLALAASPAAAAGPDPEETPAWAIDDVYPGQRITGYTIFLQVGDDSRLRVRESIVYDYGELGGDGFVRAIRLRSPYDADRDRVVDVTGIRVSSETAAADVTTTRDDDLVRLRIGDRGIPLQGQHRYEIAYVVDGALQDYGTHIQLAWEPFGAEWPVPVAGIEVNVLEVPVQSASCFAGSFGSRLPCDTVDTRSDLAAGGAYFQQRGLPSGQGLSIVVTLPPGYLDVPEPTFVERAATDAPSNRLALIVLAAVAGALVGLLGGWMLRGRRLSLQRSDGTGPSDPRGIPADPDAEVIDFGSGPRPR